MTIREEAYQLIDHLPEDSVQAIVQIMVRMIPHAHPGAEEKSALSPRMQAYQTLESLRKTGAVIDFSEAEREKAMAEKFGDFPSAGGSV